MEPAARGKSITALMVMMKISSINPPPQIGQTPLDAESNGPIYPSVMQRRALRLTLDRCSEGLCRIMREQMMLRLAVQMLTVHIAPSPRAPPPPRATIARHSG